jgi:hypothetical protein
MKMNKIFLPGVFALTMAPPLYGCDQLEATSETGHLLPMEEQEKYDQLTTEIKNKCNETIGANIDYSCSKNYCKCVDKVAMKYPESKNSWKFDQENENIRCDINLPKDFTADETMTGLLRACKIQAFDCLEYHANCKSPL